MSVFEVIFSIGKKDGFGILSIVFRIINDFQDVIAIRIQDSLIDLSEKKAFEVARIIIDNIERQGEDAKMKKRRYSIDRHLTAGGGMVVV